MSGQIAYQTMRKFVGMSRPTWEPWDKVPQAVRDAWDLAMDLSCRASRGESLAAPEPPKPSPVVSRAPLDVSPFGNSDEDHPKVVTRIRAGSPKEV